MTIRPNAMITELTLRAIDGEFAQGERRPLDYFIVRTATLVEAHVDRLLDILTASAWAPATAMEDYAVGELRAQMHQSWSARRDWLKQAFSINIAGTAEDNQFRLLVELRNALVHGAGRITDLQSKALPSRLSLEKALISTFKINIVDGAVRASPESSANVLRVARSYLVRLDAELVACPTEVLVAGYDAPRRE